MLSSGGGVWDDIPSFDTVAAEWKPRGLPTSASFMLDTRAVGYAEKLEWKGSATDKKANENSAAMTFIQR